MHVTPCSNYTHHYEIATFFSRKATEAIKEHEVHVTDFKEFQAALNPSETEKWLSAVVEWEQDRTKPNPFEITQSCKSIITTLLSLLMCRIASHQ